MAIVDVPKGTQQVLKVYIKTESDSSPVEKSVLNGININESVKNKSTCNFSIITTSKNQYEIGNFVKIVDETTADNYINLFVGIITDINIRAYSIGGDLIASISCIDFSTVLDNIIVSEVYENETLHDIIADLGYKYLYSYNDEYIDYYSCQPGGEPIIKAVFDYISFSDVLNYLCDETANNWIINITRWQHITDTVLHIFPRENDTCLDINKENIYDIEVSKTLEDYRNRQYLKAGYDTTDTQTREILTPKPDGNSKAFFARYPVAKVPTILVDNVTVSSASVGIDGVDEDKWYYWSKGSQQINQSSMATTLTSAQTISMTYQGLIKILIQADNTDGQDSTKANMYNSSGIFTKITEVAAIEEREEAVNYANGLLYKYRNMPEKITVRTNCYRHVGELVNINYPEILDDDLYFIESRNITYDSKYFYYEYNVLNGESLGNWTEFFRNIQKKSNDMLINQDVLLIKLQQQAEFIDVCNEYGITIALPSLVGTMEVGDTLGTVFYDQIEYDV
jgi:hypothetical protein